MLNATARVMVPVNITNAMLKAGTTVVEPDSSVNESAWVVSTAYSLGAEKTYPGSEYMCILTVGAVTTTPPNDPLHWKRIGPVNRLAPFDDYSNTKAVGTTSMTYVIQPGFLNGIAIYGMEGLAYSIVVKDAPGGSVIASKSGDLFEQAAGFYEYLFTDLLSIEQISFDSIPLAPAAEVTITVTSGSGSRVAIGSIKMGDWRQFKGTGSKGDTQYGAESDRKSYSFYKENFDGTYSLQKRPSSRNISCTIIVDADQAMYADSILAQILDVAVPFEASNFANYAYLNTLGFVTGSMRADNYGETSLVLKIKGNV